MLRLSDPSDLPTDFGPTVVTLGNFDGVHRGHAAVIAAVRDGEPAAASSAMTAHISEARREVDAVLAERRRQSAMP